MKYAAAAMSCIVLALCACASTPPSDYDLVLARPSPSTDEARLQECAWIETSLARQKSLATYAAMSAASPMTAIVNQDLAQRNMAVLEAGAARINCRAEFPGAALFPASAQQARISFDQCFMRCRQYTGRSNEQCFDACNR